MKKEFNLSEQREFFTRDSEFDNANSPLLPRVAKAADRLTGQTMSLGCAVGLITSNTLGEVTIRPNEADDGGGFIQLQTKKIGGGINTWQIAQFKQLGK